ncbi:MAG TPA: hemolysin family protein [Oscillospiraceae bacterium]|nr:hemolysin family protein [Oscillospiraceae bacterium]HPK34806.1 hemolysin family protein [Oscillospiraceae bacterium]HPR75856.1 hemolysin family protein [Oscillospiraceae bacterium]
MIFAFITCAAQTAAVTIADSRLKKLAEEGKKQAQSVLKMTSEPSRFYDSLDTGRIMLALAFVICTMLAFSADVTGWFVKSGGFAPILSALLLFIICTVVYLTLGYWFPKKLGAHFCEKLSLAFSGWLKLVYALNYPMTAFTKWAATGFARIFGVIPGESDEQVTEEEIRMMVDVGQEKGVIEDSEKAMINNVFEFDDRVAVEVMTHRTEICAVENIDTVDEVLKLAIDEGYSRLPVYRDDIDTIIGIVYVKDLLKYVGKQLPANINAEKVMRPPFFVPESVSCSELFRELTGRRIQLAVVVDEYGGTSGLVTIEDLLESIVGNMRDEYDDEEEEFVKTGEDTYEVDGSMLLSDLEELLDIELPEGDYDTVGGLLLSQLGHIPALEEHAEIEVAGLKFTIAEVENLRIAKVLITKLPICENE